MYAAEIKALRSELRMTEKSSITGVKSDLAILERDLASTQQRSREELGRISNAISIELNNHKVARRPVAGIGARGCPWKHLTS